MSDIPPPPPGPYPPPTDQPHVVYVQQQKQKGGCFKWLGIATAIFFALVVIGIIAAVAGSKNKNSTPHSITPTSVATGETVPASGEVGMTIAKYNAVQTGMTPEQVDAIVQPANCEQLSQTDIGGHSGFTYDCKDDVGIGNALFVFFDGAVTSKSQFGLN